MSKKEKKEKPDQIIQVPLTVFREIFKNGGDIVTVEGKKIRLELPKLDADDVGELENIGSYVEDLVSDLEEDSDDEDEDDDEDDDGDEDDEDDDEEPEEDLDID